VGYYTAGFRIGGFILLISSSMSMLFFPMFSRAVAKRDFDYIKEKIKKFERFSFLFIMPIVILIALFSTDIVVILLGEQYLPSVNIMAVVTLALFLTVFNTPYGNILNGFGKFRLTAKISIINLFVFVGIIVVFLHENILNVGPIGVAWALLITNILVGITYRYFAVKDINSLDNLLAVKFIIFGIINFIMSYYLFTEFFNENIWVRIIFLPIYLIYTFLSFHLLKWMNKEDWISVVRLFDIKAMKNYISGEMKGKR